MAKRLTIKDLIPSTEYAVQIRAVNENSASPWSRKFTFTTTDDDVAPKVPANFTWTAGNGYFQAQWDEVTKNIDESNAKVSRYVLRLEANSTYKLISIPANGDNPIEYRVTQQRIEALFGKGTDTVSARVKAINKGEIQGAYTSLLTVGIGTPNAPASGTTESIVDGIKISWTPASGFNIDGYHVYISTSGPNFTANAANRIYEGTDTTVTYNTSTYVTHYIKVRSYSRFGKESADLNLTGIPQTPFVRDITPPAVPGSLTVTVDRSGAVARAYVSWTFSATGLDDDIQQFVVRWRKTGDTDWFQDVASKDARNLYVNLPQPYANYEFQVSAMDFSGNYSGWSATTSLASGIPGAPPQTVGVTATAGLGSIQLSWTSSTHDDVTYGGYYEVQVSTSNSFPNTSETLTYKTGNTNIAVNGLSQSTVYYYRVRAVDVDANFGAYSTTGNITTGGVVIPSPTDGNPPSTSPAAVVTPGLGYLFVSWTPITNADPVTYEVHMSTTAGFTPTLGGVTRVAQTPGTVITLENDASGAALAYGTTYYVRIIAKDADTTVGNAPAPGTVGSGSPTKAGSEDITTIIADQIGSGSISTATLTITSTGSIRSNNYVANTSGFLLSASVVDIQSGIVNFGTLSTGTMTTSTLTIGANGKLIVDSTGAIQSNNYSAGSTGWKLSSTGLDLPGLTVNAGNVIGDTIAGRNLTVSGSLSSSNWNGVNAGYQLTNTTFTMYNGTITGSAVIRTNALTSNTTTTATNSGYTFAIYSGYAEFANANIYGNTTVGASSSHFIQTNGYTAGSSTGWRISGDGTASFNNATFYGAGGQRAVANSGAITFYDSGGTARGTISATVTGLRLSGIGSGALYVTSTGIGVGALSADSLEMTGAANIGSLSVTSNASIYGTLNMQGGGITNLTSVSGGVTFNNAITFSAATSFNGGNNDFPNIPTGSFTANANLNPSTGNRLRLNTSSKRYKENIRDLDVVDTDAILSLRPRVFQRNDHRDPKSDKLIGYRPDNPYYVGFIAEEAEELGLTNWVVYGPDNKPMSFAYDWWGIALQVVAREHNKKIKVLQSEIEELKEVIKSLVEKA